VSEGLISRVLFLPKKRESFIWETCYQIPPATYPDNTRSGKAPALQAMGKKYPPPPFITIVPTWSCLRWGLPCHLSYERRGALLPHHFTLTQRMTVRRYIFCGTFPQVTLAGRYPASFFHQARTFLAPLKDARPPKPSDTLSVKKNTQSEKPLNSFITI